ncbi:MAG: TolC family protein [Planctomycetia bacterium]|nr:TolC family protein [Planctomycetia bacterium]
MVRLRTVRASVILVSASYISGCVPYRPAPLDVSRAIRPVPAALPATWTFEAATRYAVEHNPDLVALRARATGAIVVPPREPLEGAVGVDSDERAELGLSLDALSLLGLGLRPLEVALARARRDEAWLAHHERARAVAGEIAECFVIDRALAELGEADHRVDVAAFVRAGFEAGSADVAASATAAAWAAEVAARDSERKRNRLALARALGLPPGSEVRPAIAALSWPAVPHVSPAAVVAARADVQRRVAAFEVADRALRVTVRAQFPTLIVEPGLAFDPATGFGSVRLRVPTGMGATVRAAEAEREAARAEVESAILDALREAGEARETWVAEIAALSAARRRAESSTALLQSARVRLEVASGSPVEAVLAADAVVDAASGLRVATVDEARSRVRAARAAGWPGLPTAP